MPRHWRQPPRNWRDLSPGQKLADIIAGVAILTGLAFLVAMALQVMAG